MRAPTFWPRAAPSSTRPWWRVTRRRRGPSRRAWRCGWRAPSALCVAAPGVVIVHGGDRALYKPAEDRIQLPAPGQFRSSKGYYATALHGLIHWSGHKSRLDRDLKGRYRCADLRLWHGGLCRRRAGGRDRCGLPVREGRGDCRTPGGSRPLPQELDRCPEGRQPGDLLGGQCCPEGGGLLGGLAAVMIHGQDRVR